MLSNNKKLIAVIGATGQQGGGVVRALQANGQFKVRALSRDPSKHPNLADEVVEADLNRPETLRAAFEGAYGVFLVTNFREAGIDELKQATAAVRAAKEAGVQHFVWSTLPNVEAISGGKFDVPHLPGLGFVRPNCAREQNSRKSTDQVRDVGPSEFSGLRHLTAMQIGVDSFVAATVDAAGRAVDPARYLSELLEAIMLADEVGLDVFGIGEHHRREFLDSAPTMILAAAATRTRKIHLTSAVTVLSAADPVRVFQEFATLDLLSNGRAEIIAGRGSFIEAFPLFGLELEDYDSLFAEKLDLLLNIRENTHVHWSGKHRAALAGQGVYPRPLQNPLPIWLGVGGTPGSFIRAGMLGLPLMVAIIGGEPHRFRPLIDRYREAGLRAGHSPDQLKVGIHSLGYVADSSTTAEDEFFPGYARSFTDIGRERGWPPVTRAHFDAQLGPTGALLVGDPETVAEKILRVNESLGGISRITFQMSVAALPHAKLLRAIELLGTDVAPMVRNSLASSQPQRVLPTVDRLAAANCAHSPTLTTQERIS
jgi:probable LLM family oxidoreductase